MPVTIRDVAEAAGVSAMSVSKVLHGKGQNVRVSEAKAQLIHKVAAELDYRPNTVARHLRARRTHTIGLLFEAHPSITRYQYYGYLIDGVVGSAFDQGYTVALCPTLVASEKSDPLSDGRFDGFIWFQLAENAERQESVRRTHVPVIVIHGGKASHMSHISCDNVQGVEIALKHLWQLGHRRIAFVVDDDCETNMELIARKRAFLNWMHINEVPLTESSILHWTTDAVEAASWWATRPQETALLFWSDALAGKFLRMAPELGISVPNRLSVVGFDSTIECEVTRPRLTSVRQPLAEMASQATQLLIQSIEAPDSPVRHIIHRCTLDVRESTARALKVEEYHETSIYTY